MELSFDEFLIKFYKSKSIPQDLTKEQIKFWFDEVTTFISTPDYEHKTIVNLSKDMKIKVIKIGIANCWLREKLLRKGYHLQKIDEIQQQTGSKMFLSPSPMWSIAQETVDKL